MVNGLWVGVGVVPLADAPSDDDCKRDLLGDDGVGCCVLVINGLVTTSFWALGLAAGWKKLFSPPTLALTFSKGRPR